MKCSPTQLAEEWPGEVLDELLAHFAEEHEREERERKEREMKARLKRRA